MTYKGIGEYRAITLTENIDALVGTVGNDTFVAGVTGAGNPTLNLSESVDGAARTDRIDIFGNINAGNFANANVKNVVTFHRIGGR